MENQLLTTAALDDLRAENARLIALLEAHGIEWRIAREFAAPADELAGHQAVEQGSSDRPPESSRLSTMEKGPQAGSSTQRSTCSAMLGR